MSTYVQEECVSGVVERVTFHSAETGWAVLKVSPFNAPASIVTVLVHQVQVFAGASMAFYGGWITHQKYGEQFKAQRVVETKPASAAALEKYLGSGLIKGVGPKTAKKIVKHFGDKTLEVFEENIELLVNVPSIAKKKLSDIKSSWEEHRAIRDVMIFLQSHGVSTLFAVKIFKQYGDDSIKTVSENPYKLARDIYGVGFFSADRIALTLGFQRDGKERIIAGIKHVLAGSRDFGHCYLTREQVVGGTEELLELTCEDRVIELLESLILEHEIYFRMLPSSEFEDTVQCYYSKSLYRDEESVADRVKTLSRIPVPLDVTRADNWISRYCELFKIQLSDEQKAAVLGIAGKTFSILTGGPGCGKTTTLKVLVKLINAMKKRVLLAAPTGRAAQRMGEVVGIEAKTLHRLLEWAPDKGGFKKNEQTPLDCDFLVVDECSMLDISLAASLFKAIPNSCQVLFIGDPDQLPSVGAGAVLADLLSCETVTHYRLTKVFRQAAQSDIIRFAHEINSGVVPKIISPIFRRNVWTEPVDCLFIDSEEATQEQAKFVTKAKNAVQNVIQSNQEYVIQSEGLVTGTLHKVAEAAVVDELYQPDVESEEVNRGPVLTIPKKFSHVDLNQLSMTQNSVEELKEVLKNVHPWSTLNYGMTALDTIRRLYTTSIKKKLGDKCEIQILTPQVRGSLGTHNLNRFIQECVNPPKEGVYQIQVGDRFYRVGDRVIQTRNNYDLNVFNGDIGEIIGIDSEDWSCRVFYKDQNKEVVYKREDVSEISLAYGITIHKSQGSEFDAVIIPVSTQHFKMLYRNLIYTGLTRAKKLTVFVGSRKALALAVKNMDNSERQTALEFLITGN